MALVLRPSSTASSLLLSHQSRPRCSNLYSISRGFQPPPGCWPLRCSGVCKVQRPEGAKGSADQHYLNSLTAGVAPAAPSSTSETKGPHQGAPLRWAPLVRGLAAACLVCAVGQAILPQAALAATAGAAASAEGNNVIAGALSIILHLDHHMSELIATHGQATYAILFAIVFAETGCVVTPFLPGDSLLFAAGAFAGMGKLSISLLIPVFLISAILGDAVNYAVGSNFGGWALRSNLVRPEFVAKTQKFYEKYGGKTVVLARFVPIIRTFAPFVAGIGSMPYSKFATYNVAGALLWVALFVGGGYFFGGLPFVQKNFTLVVLGIVAVSVVPVIVELIQARREEQDGGPGLPPLKQ